MKRRGQRTARKIAVRIISLLSAAVVAFCAASFQATCIDDDVNGTDVCAYANATIGLVQKGDTIKKKRSGTDLSIEKKKVKKLAARAGKKKTLKITFVGNSITLHDYSVYWYGRWGMAATIANSDYVHQTVYALNQYIKVNYKAVHFSDWETDAANRTGELARLDSAIAEDTDVLVIQLGENLKNGDRAYEDWKNLLEYVKELAPKAKLVVVGNFWYSQFEFMKKAAAAECGVTYVDLYDMQFDKTWRRHVGESTSGDDGATHQIYYQDVAEHPNDAAMKEIARRILASL